MKRGLILLLCSFISFNFAFSQIIVKGNVTDASTSEPLIGATIIFGKGKGTVTDIDGNYSFEISEGERNLTISYVGYKQLSKRISVSKNSSVFNFKLKTLLLNEVQVTADLAKERETPVAFSSIPIKKITEELASQDIPMILN